MSHSSEGTPPVVLRDVLTLGRAVHLGELYDQRTGNFLGVDLYPKDKLVVDDINISSSDLTLSLSKTHEDKAQLLDISAKLSLDILGGLISVSGSAQYVKDTKSNTEQYAYAMALQMRLKEKRLLFGESGMGHDYLDVALGDYIAQGLATHFVSGITYGGSYIVNLVARQSEFTEEELIEGSLELQLKKLPGAVGLEGEAKVKAKQEYSKLDDKFDLVIHGDVNLDRVPVNPQDVLDTFPNASQLIQKDGGVPISVTLQPIPKEISKVAKVFELKARIVDDVLKAFSNLDDIRSRFSVLKERVKKLQAFIPELARTTNSVASEYVKEHNDLLEKLGDFLLEYQKGNPLEPRGLLEDVEKLRMAHLEPASTQTKYPRTLKGLEDEFSHFEYFVNSIRKDKKVLRTSPYSTINVGVERSLHLSTIDDIVDSIVVQSKIPLFIMPSVSGSKSKPVLPVLAFLALVKKHDAFFGDFKNPPFLFYAENLKDLEGLPNYEAFKEPKKPCFFVGEVRDSEMVWDDSPKEPDPPDRNLTPDVTFPLSYNSYYGDLRLPIDPVNARKSFTIQFQSKELGSSDVYILMLRFRYSSGTYVSFKGTLEVYDDGNNLFMKGSKIPPPGDQFTATLVQDVLNGERILYLNGGEVARKQFSVGDVFGDETEIYIDLSAKRGGYEADLSGFKAFTRPLTGEEVKLLVSESK